VMTRAKALSVGRTLLAPVVASALASLVVVAGQGHITRAAREVFVVSLFYSIPISLAGGVLMPMVVRWVGRPGMTLTVAMSVALLLAAAAGSLVGSVLLLTAGPLTR